MSINLSAVPYKSLLGKLLRLPLNLLPKEMEIPILQGKLRGYKWIVGSSIHGCWLGTYEFAKQHVFQHYIMPNDIVFDIGANVGYYTLLASVLVGKDGQVFAFEPLPANVRYMNCHITSNHISNTTVFQAAVSDYSGTAYFDEGEHNSQGTLSQSGKMEVVCVSLDDLFAAETIPMPSVLKIDVEGAELLVLQGARQLLAKSRPKIFLATHGKELHRACSSFLRAIGYTIQSLTEDDIYATDELLALPN